MQVFFFFKQKTAYEMRISDWSSDVCSSDLHLLPYVVLVGLLAGVVIDTATNIESVRLGVVLGWPAVVVVAIGWREMPDFATIAGLPMALLWLSAVIGYLWIGLEHRFASAPIVGLLAIAIGLGDRKSTRLNSSH